ncbi:KIR protein [Plasmodium coatneyi]|uniref:KIR protein n=1 Tax=Plasmodium coatneyi TaxID=208452 RepID=A0A1B1E0E1_9APIC|nr:KIR protein [Plasmodium coatneyi]ANQ08317.1 KIR protein [Plasmodium coatneyi]
MNEVHNNNQKPTLYSEWIYDMLKEGGGQLVPYKLVTQLEQELNGYTQVKKSAHTIATACSFVSEVRKKEQADSGICTWFYYWLGNMLFNEGKLSSISDVMDIIYTAWGKSDLGNSCTKDNTHNDGVDFYSKKSEFDFKKDYEPQEEQEQCKSDSRDGSSGPYCTKFIGKYGNSCTRNSSQLTCTWKNLKKPSAGDDFDLDIGKMDLDNKDQDPILSNLPSTKAYKKFNEANGTCEEDGDVSLPLEIEGAFPGSLKTGNQRYLNRLKDVWCYASKGGEGNLTDVERCSFLYYYIGYTFSEYFTHDSSFQTFMDTVRKELEQLSDVDGEKCDIVPSCSGRTHFTWEKEVYDFIQDHGTIRTTLEGSEITCTKEFLQHLEDVAGAFGTMGWHCTKNATKDGKYCQKLNSAHKPNKLVELLKTKCTLPETQKYIIQRIETLGILPSTGTSSGTGTIVCSTLSVLGLPMLGYFLYKYNLLPSWFGNHFGGGSSKIRKRKKRSTRSNFDALTEYTTEDGTSTIAPSTIGDSTIGSTVEDNSTIYNDERRPPPRRSSSGRGSNSRPQQHRQQQQRPQRQQKQRNISYQNI